MIHYYKEGKPEGKKLLLLHGTGGDERSLVEIAEVLDEDSTILSFRGTVSEGGMNRFFKRKDVGVYDYESLEAETDRLYEAIKKVSVQENVPLSDWIIVGYSNGANIAAHLLLERETELRQGIFLHVTTLFRHTQTFSLADKDIFASFSVNDPIVSQEEFDEFVESFTSRGGKVTVAKSASGHQISQEEFTAAYQWLHRQ